MNSPMCFYIGSVTKRFIAFHTFVSFFSLVKMHKINKKVRNSNLYELCNDFLSYKDKQMMNYIQDICRAFRLLLKLYVERKNACFQPE